MSFGLLLQSEMKCDPAYANLLHEREAKAVSAEIPLPQCGYDGHTVKISLAVSDAERQSACNLVNRMYSWRGYGNAHQIRSAETLTTFTVWSDENIIGTLTLSVDGGEGLAADRIFRDEIDAFRRAPGARVCELTKLAFDAECSSKPLLASLFHTIFIYGRRKYACTDLFIEVNPRHVRFYEAMLGFERVGTLKTNESVAAPSQLMHLKVADIQRLISEHTRPENRASQRSLYGMFFGREEEARVRAHLMPVLASARLARPTANFDR